MRKRLTYIDTAKCLTIFLMVLCHTMVPRSVDIVVHAFHMPVFFILSGWVFVGEKHISFKKFAISRAKTLLIPYLFWGVALPLLWNVFYIFYDRQKVVSVSYFAYSLLYNNAEHSPFAAVQWFLTCMFFTQIISWAVLRWTKQKCWLVALFGVFFAVLGWIYPFLVPIRLPLSLDVSFSATAFFLLGWLISHELIPRLKDIQKKVLLSPICLVLELAVGLILAIRNGYVNMRLILFNDPVLFYSAATILSLFVLHGGYYLSRLLEKCKGLFDKILFLGQNTLSILVLNQLFIQAAKLMLNQNALYLQRSAGAKYAIWFVFSVCFMAVMIPVIRLIQKAIPFSVGQKK